MRGTPTPATPCRWPSAPGQARMRVPHGHQRRTQSIGAGAVPALHPLGRVGDARDITPAITDLLTDQASYVAGVIRDMDGGDVPCRNKE
jgi:hypothetical protein